MIDREFDIRTGIINNADKIRGAEEFIFVEKLTQELMQKVSFEYDIAVERFIKEMGFSSHSELKDRGYMLVVEKDGSNITTSSNCDDGNINLEYKENIRFKLYKEVSMDAVAIMNIVPLKKRI